MKFDKVYNDLFEKLGLNEMAIHLHNEEPIIDPITGARAKHSPRNASQRNKWSQEGTPEIGTDTSSDKQSKIDRFKNTFKQAFAERFAKKMRGEAKGYDCYTMTDLTDAVKSAASSIDSPNFTRTQVSPEAVYDVFTDKLINRLFPTGVDPSRTWEEFTDPQGPVFQNTKHAFKDTVEHFTDIIGTQPQLPLSQNARLGHFIKNILKNVIIDSGTVLSDIDDADYLEGSKASRGRQSLAAKAADATAPKFTVHEESRRLDEMPVSLKKDTTLGDTTGFDTMRRVMRHTFADKHSRINDPKNVEGSNTHHIGNLARHLSGQASISDVPAESIHNASDIFAKIVHDKMFEIHKGVNPAMNQKEFRALMTKAVSDAIEILQDEHGVDVFEEINNLPEFTARIIDNGLKDMFASVRTGYDNTFKTWKKSLPEAKADEPEDESDPEDVEEDEVTPAKPVVESDKNKLQDNEDEDSDDDEDDEDSDDDEDGEDVAYKQGILKDEEDSFVPEEEEEEEEEEETEEEEEENADAASARVERTGRDIAQMFMQALSDLESEEDSEDDDIVEDDNMLDDEDNDVKPYLSRGGVEDEEEERYRSWGDVQDSDDY